jgi:uncharacterized protein
MTSLAPIRDNTALSRFELDDDGVTVVLNYKLADGVISFNHTETPVEARGRGLASKLVESAFAAARARGLKVAPRCAFVRDYVGKHPEVRAMVA